MVWNKYSQLYVGGLATSPWQHDLGKSQILAVVHQVVYCLHRHNTQLPLKLQIVIVMFPLFIYSTSKIIFVSFGTVGILGGILRLYRTDRRRKPSKLQQMTLTGFNPGAPKRTNNIWILFASLFHRSVSTNKQMYFLHTNKECKGKERERSIKCHNLYTEHRQGGHTDAHTG